MKKKIFTAAIGVGMVLAAVAPAFAGLSVSNTGPDSKLDARINRIKNHVFNLSNTYTLNQTVVANQTTGGNDSSNNTGNGTALAGNVTGNHTSQVEANSVNLDMNLSADCNCDSNITVNVTGPNSTANAIVDNTKNSTVNVTNSGTVNNSFTSIVSTGGNTASHNTGNGLAVGGDTNVWSLITTKLNSVMYKISM